MKTKRPAAIRRAFRNVVDTLLAVEDERDLREFRGLRFEKLKGNRSHQYSVRLNSQFRLIFEIQTSKPKNVIHIMSVEDYH